MGSGSGNWVVFDAFPYYDYTNFLGALHDMAPNIDLVGILDRAVEFIWFRDTKLESWPFDYPTLPSLVTLSTNRDWLPSLLDKWKYQLDTEGLDIVILQARMKYIALFEAWFEARPRPRARVRLLSESCVPYESHPPKFQRPN